MAFGIRYCTRTLPFLDVIKKEGLVYGQSICPRCNDQQELIIFYNAPIQDMAYTELVVSKNACLVGNFKFYFLLNLYELAYAMGLDPALEVSQKFLVLIVSSYSYSCAKAILKPQNSVQWLLCGPDCLLSALYEEVWKVRIAEIKPRYESLQKRLDSSPLYPPRFNWHQPRYYRTDKNKVLPGDNSKYSSTSKVFTLSQKVVKPLSRSELLIKLK